MTTVELIETQSITSWIKEGVAAKIISWTVNVSPFAHYWNLQVSYNQGIVWQSWYYYFCDVGRAVKLRWNRRNRCCSNDYSRNIWLSDIEFSKRCFREGVVIIYQSYLRWQGIKNDVIYVQAGRGCINAKQQEIIINLISVDFQFLICSWICLINIDYIVLSIKIKDFVKVGKRTHISRHTLKIMID